MPIIHAIVHHIQRHADSAANLAMRNSELPHNDATTNLLDKLKGSFFSRISREHGSFDREAETPPPLAQVLETIGQAKYGNTLVNNQGESPGNPHHA